MARVGRATWPGQKGTTRTSPAALLRPGGGGVEAAAESQRARGRRGDSDRTGGPATEARTTDLDKWGALTAIWTGHLHPARRASGDAGGGQDAPK